MTETLGPALGVDEEPPPEYGQVIVKVENRDLSADEEAPKLKLPFSSIGVTSMNVISTLSLSHSRYIRGPSPSPKGI